MDRRPTASAPAAPAAQRAAERGGGAEGDRGAATGAPERSRGAVAGIRTAAEHDRGTATAAERNRGTATAAGAERDRGGAAGIGTAAERDGGAATGAAEDALAGTAEPGTAEPGTAQGPVADRGADAGAAAAPDDGTAARDAIPTHVATVVRIERLSPTFVRVTLGGLERFQPVGADQFAYLLLPPPGRDRLTIDEGFRWTDYERMAEADRPVGAYYTIRAHRPGQGEVDLDVYLHEPAGAASAWAARAVLGDPAALWGPRTAWAPPTGTDGWLLVADETGLPATAAILEALPRDATVRAVIEVASPAEEWALPCGPRTEVTWLHRGGAPAGTTTLLADAVRALRLPGSSAYVWGGAESRAMTAVRRHLRRELGLAKEQVSLTPYWRHAAHADDPLPTEDD